VNTHQQAVPRGRGGRRQIQEGRVHADRETATDDIRCYADYSY
jgi:hypothetical protein